MNPIPRILQAEPGITEANRQTLEKVSRLLDLLDSAVDFSEATDSRLMSMGDPLPVYVMIDVDAKDLRDAITLYNSFS